LAGGLLFGFACVLGYMSNANTVGSTSEHSSFLDPDLYFAGHINYTKRANKRGDAGLLFIGIVFTLGALAAIIIPLYMHSIGANASLGAVMWGILALMFGGLMLYGGIQEVAQDKRFKKNSKVYEGKIYEYRTNPKYKMNGAPALALLVRFFNDDGNIDEVVVNTTSFKEKDFPLGYTVKFRYDSNRADLVRKSVTYEHIVRETELMDSTLDVQKMKKLGDSKLRKAICLSCGRENEIPEGISGICSYCGSRIE